MRLQFGIRLIRILEIPDEGRFEHAFRHLLKTHDGVGDGSLGGAFRVPRDL